MTANSAFRASAAALRMQPRGSRVEPVVGFQSAKAAQIAAFFVSSSGGKIDKLKLAKLAYLAERESLARYDAPMTYDELYSLPHGPICSSALNGVDGNLQNFPEWNRFQRHGRDKVFGKTVNREQLDELSDAEVEILDYVWAEFGGMSASEIRNYTHNKENIPEYVEVATGRRLPIKYEEVLSALGKSPRTIDFVVREIESFRLLDMNFAR